MFSEKPEIGRAVKAILDRLHSLEEGKTITHTEIENLSGFEKDSSKWRTTMRRVVRDAANSGILLRADRGIGYRRLRPDEVGGGVCVYRTRRANGQLRRGLRELRNFEMSRVPLHQRRVAMEMADQWEKQQIENQAAVRIIRKTETVPQRSA